MSHMIDTSNGRANIAFVGPRNNIWHRLGAQMQPGMSVDSWAIQAGLKRGHSQVQSSTGLPQ